MKTLRLIFALLVLADAVVLGFVLGYSWASRGLNNAERQELAELRWITTKNPFSP